MTDVATLVPRAAKVSTGIVGHLESLLVQAKAGTIRELCTVTMLDSNGGYTTWSSETDDAVRQLGQVVRLVHRMQVAMDVNTK